MPLYSRLMAQGAGDAVKGILGTANWHWTLQDEATKVFTKSFGQEYGEPPSQAAQTCYVQALLYANACEKAGTFYPPEVIKTLEGFKFDGMGNGPTEYRAGDHQCFKDVLVMRGAEKPGNRFGLLEVVKVVPRKQVDYPADMGGGQLGPYTARPEPAPRRDPRQRRRFGLPSSRRELLPDPDTPEAHGRDTAATAQRLGQGRRLCVDRARSDLDFGTLGVVNFAHGALFMLGAFCAVTMQMLLTLSRQVKDESVTFFDSYKEIPYLEIWFGDAGTQLIDYAVPLSILLAIPVMLLVGVAIERGLISHFYRRPHADQILVTFGLAIVLQEIIKAYFGANSIPTPAPALLSGTAPVGSWLGLGDTLDYPKWRLVYFAFSVLVIAAVFAFLRFTTFGMVVRAGMRDRDRGSVRHQHRAPLHDRVRPCRAGGGRGRRDVHTDPRTRLPHRMESWCCPSGRRRRRHGVAGRAVTAGFLLGILSRSPR